MKKAVLAYSGGLDTSFLANLDLNLLVAAACVGGIGFALHDLIKAYACRYWPSVQGKIILSKPRYNASGHKRIPWQPDVFYFTNVQYVFSVNGIEYTGTRIFLRDFGSGDANHISNLLNKYKSGSQVSIYYNRNNPQDCVLEPIQPSAYFWVCCGALGVCLFLLSVFMLNKT